MVETFQFFVFVTLVSDTLFFNTSILFFAKHFFLYLLRFKTVFFSTSILKENPQNDSLSFASFIFRVATF